MSNVTPFLWFDGRAEEAANFYVATFRAGGRSASITEDLRCGDAGPSPKGSVLTVSFTLDGQDFVALNGGPHYSFTPAVSFMMTCTTQTEIDYFWDALGAGGVPFACGWLNDRFGLSWQVTPAILLEYLKSSDQEASARAMKAMMGMIKLDIAQLAAAYEGNG